MTSFSWETMPIKHKIALFSLTVVAVTWLVYSFLLLPQWTNIDELTTQYNTERQQVKVIEDFLVLHPNPEQSLFELDSKITPVNTMLPDNPEFSSFLIQVEQLSRECGLQLSHVKPIRATNKEGYIEYEVEVTINGSFLQTMNFLSNIENKARFISVTNVAMQTGKNNLESKITTNTYSYGVPTVPATNNAKTTDNKK